MSLLRMSITGAVMIAVIAAVRALTLHRLPKRTFPALWAAALVRLLVPYSLPSALSVYSLLARLSPAAEAGTTTTAAAAVLPVMTGTEPVTAAVTGAGAAVSASAAAVDPWALVWLIGALAVAAFFAVAWIRCRRQFRESLPVESEAVTNWLSAHRLRRTVAVRRSDRVDTPLTYGVLRPVILLPKSTDWTDGEGLEYVLTHEYVHIRRLDAVFKLALTAAVCVHWFNPLVWVMYALANRDLELACDEAVLRRLGPDAREAYAMTLLRLEAARSGLQPLCSHFSQNAMRERIVAIMKMKKLSVAALIAAAVLVIGVTAGFATSERTDAEDTDKTVETAENTAQEETVDYTDEVPIVQNPIYTVVRDEPTYAQFVIIGSYRYTVGTEESEREIVRYALDEVELSIYDGYKAWKAGTEMDLDAVTLEEQYPGTVGSLLLTIPGTWTEDTEYYVSLNGGTAVPVYIWVADNADAATASEAAGALSGAVYTSDTELGYGYVERTGDNAVAYMKVIIDKYEPYGITFERKGDFGNLYWHGKLVADLFDAAPGFVTTINSTDKGGGIHLETVYDEDGNLVGVEQFEGHG